MKSLLFSIFTLAVLLINALLSMRVDPLPYTGGRARDEEERARRNSSSLAAMFGEFRTTLSDVMFIKTERYLHAGVGYAVHHTAMSAEDLAEEVDEHQSELGVHDDHDHHHHDHDHEHIEGLEIDHEHAGTATLIPRADRDFRGPIGRLHREVKPWRDPSKPHAHTDGRELLPWFRVMTMSDPGYIQGYVAGGFWLQTESLDLAISFIEEGLEKNPDDFQLHVSRGLLRVRKARRAGDLNAAVLEPEVRSLLELALADVLRAAELMQRVRPDDVDEDGFGSGGWGRYHESDAMASAHLSVSLTRNLGDHQTAAELARTFLEI
ncbi:MAG: hypothetical protein LAT83_23850, partial [Kiritimatiellae bacterium]|nr:hypothetical protein [Kiritimatiellia bacterium]